MGAGRSTSRTRGSVSGARGGWTHVLGRPLDRVPIPRATAEEKRLQALVTGATSRAGSAGGRSTPVVVGGGVRVTVRTPPPPHLPRPRAAPRRSASRAARAAARPRAGAAAGRGWRRRRPPGAPAPRAG